MENRLRPRFQLQGDHSLRDSVGDGGTPSILVPPPCGFGISTARTGGGKYVPEDILFHS